MIAAGVNEMVKVEVLGTGCAKCKSLTKNVEKAVQELGIKDEIEPAIQVIVIENLITFPNRKLYSIMLH